MDTRDAGRMGGLAKVRKGFATLSIPERKAIAKKGVDARAKKAKAKKNATKEKKRS